MALGQWIASTPKQIISDTLKLSDNTLNKLKTEKQFVVAKDNWLKVTGMMVDSSSNVELARGILPR